MRALIMAGGSGSRLGRAEKPLALLCGTPMISWIAGAFRGAGCEPVAVVSPRTPMTANWCRAHDVAVIRTAGTGYVEDMVAAVRLLEEQRPVIVSVADIPCITPAIIGQILSAYADCGKEALSTWVPARIVRSCREGMPYRETVDGTEACPAGVNILNGAAIGGEQDECRLLLDEIRLSLNVNTRADRARAEAFLSAQQTR